MSNISERVTRLSPKQRQLLALRLKKDSEQALQQSDSIKKSAEEQQGALPLSFAQQRLWSLAQLAPEHSAHNMTYTVRLHGELHLACLQDSLDALSERHESLRTVFRLQDDKPVQVVEKAGKSLLLLIDLRGLVATHREQHLHLLAQQEAQSSFNLTAGPLLRVTPVRLTECEHTLLLTAHPIIFDSWSLTIFARELSELYNASFGEHLSPLPPLPLQYADFAYRQHNQWQGGAWKQHINYWTKQLQGAIPLDLPTDRPGTEPPDAAGAFAPFNLSVQLSENLRDLSRQEDVTLFMTLLAAFLTLLYRYTGRADLIVGTEVPNRLQVETQGIIGHFANLLALRTDLSGHPTFREVLRLVRRVVIDAYTHQELPFEKLIELLHLEKNTHQNPLIRILFVLQESQAASLALHGLELSPLPPDSNGTRFDLAVSLKEGEQGLSGEVNYRSSLFDLSTIKRLIQHFDTLLRSIVSQPDCLIDSLEMYDEIEQKELTKGKTASHEVHRQKLRTTKRSVVDFEYPTQRE